MDASIASIIVAIIALIGSIVVPLIKDYNENKKGYTRKVISEKLDMLTESIDKNRDSLHSYEKMTLRGDILTAAESINLWKAGDKTYSFISTNSEWWDLLRNKMDMYEDLCKDTGDPNHKVKLALEIINQADRELHDIH